MQFLAAGGNTLHFEYRQADPAKPVIVFINALGTDMRIWRPVTTLFGANASTLCYDKRGHGLSDLGAAECTIDDHVDDLTRLVDHLSAEKVVLCGLSVGGLVSQAFWSRQPDRVSALVLCDTAHKVGTEASWDERIAAIRRDGINAIADSILEKWFTPAFHRTFPEQLAGIRNMLVRQPADGYVATCAALRDADHTDIVQRIDVPTLCLVGDQDGSTPPDLVRSMADLIPLAEFQIISDAGHIVCVEQPVELVNRMTSFLRHNLIGRLA